MTKFQTKFLILLVFFLIKFLNQKKTNLEYFEFFAPEFTLRPDLPRRTENMNSKEVNLFNAFIKEFLFLVY